MDANVAGVFTVRIVEPVTLPIFADIELVPAETLLAKPAELIVATAVDADAHVATLVTFDVLPSEYVPVAANCCVFPTKFVGFAGVTAMEFNVGGALTVNSVFPLVDPSVADIVLVPTATADARPPLLIVATPVLPDAHVATLVRLDVLPSEYVAVAVNCRVVPVKLVGLAGLTAIELKVAGAAA